MPGYSVEDLPEDFWTEDDNQEFGLSEDQIFDVEPPTRNETPGKPFEPATMSRAATDDLLREIYGPSADAPLWAQAVDKISKGAVATGTRGVGGRGSENILQSGIGVGLAVGDFPKNLTLKILQYYDPKTYNEIIKDPQKMEAVQRAIGINPETKATLEQELQRSKAIQKYDYPKTKTTQEAGDNWYKTPSWWLENGGDVAFQLATMVGSNAVAPGSGLALAGVQSGSQSRNDAVERLRARGYENPDAELMGLGEGAVMGVVEAALEKLPLEMFQGNTELKKSVFEAAAKRLLATGGAGLAESAEEAGAGVAQDVLQKYIEQDPALAEKTLGELVLNEQRAKEAALGAFGGAGLRGAAALAETATDEVNLQLDKKQIAARQAEEIRSRPDGQKQLEELSKNLSPSRKDFKKAGFDTGLLRLNQQERAEFVRGLSQKQPISPPSETEVISETTIPSQVEAQPPTAPVNELAAEVQEETRAPDDLVNSLIPEAVEEAIGKTGGKGTTKESDFFHPEKGIWSTAVKAAKKSIGFKSGSVLTKEAQKQLSEDATFRAGEEFDKNVDHKSLKTTVAEAVKDLVPYIEEHPEFADYYSHETDRERKLLSQKYPEIATDQSKFDLYRLLNGVASAQTDLFKNTEETDLAYGGFKQTGRVPVVVEKVEGKDRPVYSLPKESEFGATLPSEVDTIEKTIQEMDKEIPADIRQSLLQNERLTEAQYEQLKPISKKYMYKIFTSSAGLAIKLWHEWARGGSDAFKSRVRSAFEVAGGSSQYNKSRNYQAINKILDKFDGDTEQMMEWMKERVTFDQFKKDRAEAGFSETIAELAEVKDTIWVAEGQSNLIPRTFLFGPKVGAYILNRLGDGRYNTMDVWESRAWRSYFKNLGDEEMGIASGVPRRVYMRAAKMFPEVFKEVTGKDIEVSAGQAARWYFIMESMRKAGYGKGGGKQTIAQYTEELMSRWVNQQLGGEHLDMEAVVNELAKEPAKPKTKKIKTKESDIAMERLEEQGRLSRERKAAREDAARGELTKTTIVTAPTEKTVEDITVSASKPAGEINVPEKTNKEPEDRTEPPITRKPNEASPARKRIQTKPRPTVERTEPSTAAETERVEEGAIETISAQEAEDAGRSVPREYIKPSGKVTLYRYSKAYRGKTYTIDPSKATPNPYSLNEFKRASTPRTFFYLNISEKEGIVGDNLYTTEVDANKIYNLIKDPEKFKAAHKLIGGYNFDEIFKDLQDAGYQGVYYNPGFHVVAMFTPTMGKATVDVIKNVDSQAIWSGVDKQITEGTPAGFTLDAKNGQMVSNGFVVAPAKSSEFVIDLKQTKDYEIPDLIKQYAGRVADTLSQSTYHLGGWVDGNRFVLDTTIVVDSKEEAMQIARENNQDAIFDLNTGTSIYLDQGTADSYNPSASLTQTISQEESQKKPAKSKRQIVRDLMEMAGITVTAGDFKGALKNAGGYYRWINSFKIPGRELALRKDYLADVGVAVHEVAHFLDDRFNFTGRKRVGGREIGPGSLEAVAAGDPRLQQVLAKMAYYDYDKSRQMLAEGFAEVTRLYVTSPDPARIIDSEVLEFYEANVLTNGTVRNIIDETRADVLAYDQQSDFEKLNHAIHTPGSELIAPNESYFQKYDRDIKRAINRVIRKTQFDASYDVVLAEEHIERQFKEHWDNLTPAAKRGITADKAWEKVLRDSGGKTSQLKMSLTNAAGEQAAMVVQEGVSHPITGKKVGKARSPKQIFSGFSIAELKEFAQYMYAKVGLERMARALSRGKEYQIGEVDPKTLVSLVNRIENGPNAEKYRKASREITDFFNDLVDLQVSEGLLSKKEGEVIKNSHKLFMPFYRQIIGGLGKSSGFLGVKSAFRKLRGGSVMPVLNVYDAIIDRTQEVYSGINRHRVEASFINMAKISGAGAPFVTRITSADLKLSKKELLEQRVSRGEITQEAAEDVLEDNDISVVDLINSAQPGYANADNAIIVFRNEKGITETYRIDPDVYKAMTAGNNPVYSELVAGVLSVVGSPIRLGKYFMVTLNLPYFLPKNVVRDNKTALLKGLQDIGPEDNTGVFFRTQKEIARGAQGLLKDNRSDVDKLYDRIGGSRSTLLRTSAQLRRGGASAGARASKFKRLVFGKGEKGSKLQQVSDGVIALADKIEKINNIAELAPRKAAFYNTLVTLSKSTNEFKIGPNGEITGEIPQWAIARAMNNALEVTTNFVRRGQWSNYGEHLFLFYNAALAGTYSQVLTVENAAKKWQQGDKRPTVRLVANGAAAIAARLMFLYYLMHWEDDEGNSLWNKYVETSKYPDSDAIPVPVPGGYSIFRMPREREWKILSNIADLAADITFSENKYKTWDDYANSALNVLRGEVGSRIPFTGGPLSMGAQLYSGQDWFRGRDIETKIDKRQLVQYRASDSTSAPAKWLSEHGAGQILGLSPKEIDFVSRNTIGSMPFNLVDWVNGEGISKAPFLGAFFSNDVPRESVNDVYIASERNIQKLEAHNAGLVEYTPAEIEDMRNMEISLGIAQHIMTDIRASNISDEMKAKYMTGISRWALERSPLAQYPNPLLEYSNEDLPLEIRKTIIRSIQSASKLPRKSGLDTEQGRKKFVEQVEAKSRLGKNLNQLLEKTQ